MAGPRLLAAVSLALLALAPSTLAAALPVVASGGMEGPGWIRWTVRFENTTRMEFEHAMRMDGSYGAVSSTMLDAEGGLVRFATSFGYGGPGARGPLGLLADGGTAREVRGGAAAVCHPACTGTYHVFAFAASTYSVSSFSGAFRADNATLVEEVRHAGDTFAWTTRPMPRPVLGLVTGPEDRLPSPVSAERAFQVDGRLLGQFDHSRGARFLVETPAGTRECEGTPLGCILSNVRDGPGRHVFRYEQGVPAGHAFMYAAAVDVP